MALKLGQLTERTLLGREQPAHLDGGALPSLAFSASISYRGEHRNYDAAHHGATYCRRNAGIGPLLCSSRSASSRA